MSSTDDLDRLTERHPGGIDVHTELDPFALVTVRAVALRLSGPVDRAALLARYPATHDALVIGESGERSLPLGDALDALEGARWLVLAPQEPLADLADPSSVARLAARLRAPDGCPWDREQTHATLRPHLLEEAYEALDALDAGDSDKLADELGDLLFQIAIHAQLGREEGTFDLGAVSRRIGEKLIRRHPHVFAGVALVDDLLLQWERIKRSEAKTPRSLLDGVPRSLPALFASERLQERAARVGLAPPRVELPLDLDDADFLGDVLFDLVGEARDRGFDAEKALRDANARYAARVARVEERAHAQGRELESFTADELRRMWEDAQ